MIKKQPETSKSIARNVIYGFSTWLLPLALSFVATPIIVKSLGHEDYGIYALILGFIAYSFNFNVGRAVTKYIAEYRANGENEKIRDVISATLFVNFAVGLFGLAAICLLANWLVSDVFRIESDAQNKTVNALYISSLIIFFSTINQVFNAILQGIQRFDVYSKIFNVYNFCIIGGNLFLVLKGFGLVPLLIWNLLITFLTCFVFYRSAKMLLPEVGFTFGFSRRTLKMVLSFSWGVIGYQILANVLLLFERSWITRKLGSENLTYYVVPMMLAVYLHGFISSLTMVIFPLASELKDNKEKLLRLYLKATKIVLMLTVFPAMTLIVESKNFLTLWMGAEFADKSSDLLVIHTVTFGLTAITVVAWFMTEGLGFPNYNCFVFVLCLIISISGMFWLTQDYGNFGVAIGRLAGFGTIFFSIFYVEKWFFKAIQLRFWLKITGIVGIAAIIAGIAEKFLSNIFSLSWLTFILSVGISGVIYLSCLWILKFLTEEEKLIFKNLIGR